MKYIILGFFLLVLVACSNDSDDSETKTKNDHIWKHQTDALKQTEDLAEQLEKEFKRKMEQLDETQK